MTLGDNISADMHNQDLLLDCIPHHIVKISHGHSSLPEGQIR